MRKGFCALVILVLGAGSALGQSASLVQTLPVSQPAVQEKTKPASKDNSTWVLAGPGQDAACGGTCYGNSPCPCCDCQQDATPEGERFWGSAEYLFGWIKSSPVPALVTASNVGSNAILGRNGTTVLFGGSPVDNEERQGGRFTLGYWLNCDQSLGIEGSYLFLASRSVDFSAAGPDGPGQQVIGRPFFNTASGRPDAELVAFPGLLQGRVGVNLSSRLQGAELNAVSRLCGCGCSCWKVDVLAGFRFLDLNEGLGINENLTVNPNVPLTGGTNFRIFDQFDTKNEFYGGQIGLRTEYCTGPWSVNVTAKIALGDSHEEAAINGGTTIIPPGGPATVARAGILALPSNIGTFSHDTFAVVPELGITFGYQVNCHLRAFVGYNFLYWSDVARPGDQISLAVNPLQFPRTAGPAPSTAGPPFFSFKETDFWAQAITFGVEVRY
jgi:hypothetical protein